MKYTYEEITSDFGTSIKRTDENGVESWIPTDPANADYQAYLNKDTLPSESSIPTTPQAGA
jgi:hypothetical protein